MRLFFHSIVLLGLLNGIAPINATEPEVWEIDLSKSELPRWTGLTDPKTKEKWLIGTELGRGSYGRVYEVFKEGKNCHNCRKAIKVLLRQDTLPGPPSESRLALDKYLLEGNAKYIRYESLVRSFKLEDSPKTYSVQMMELAGESVGSQVLQLQMGKIDGQRVKPFRKTKHLKKRVQQLGQIADDLFDAVHELDAQGFIHLDIKPGNLLFQKGNTGSIYLGDLDGVQFSDNVSSILFTHKYVSPEVLLRASYQMDVAVDAKSDIFSIGLSIHDLTFGSHLLEDLHDYQKENIYGKELPEDEIKKIILEKYRGYRETATKNFDRLLNGVGKDPELHGELKKLRDIVLGAIEIDPSVRIYKIPPELKLKFDQQGCESLRMRLMTFLSGNP